jgi:hypothetical protein
MQFDKVAVDVVPGGGISRATSLSLGRLNPLSLVNLILSGRSHHNAGKGDRPKAHAALAKAMESAAPEQLSDTVLRTEGTDFVDDMLWKKRHGDKDPGPWYNRIGGRIMQNPRTTSPMKALAALVYIPNAISSNLMRSSHYSPAADAAVVYGDEPAVSTHELGHAVDFNDQSGPKPGLGGRAVRDAYTLLYGMVPPARLWHEGQANLKSNTALNEGLKDDPVALNDIKVRRDRVLPAGYGSYVGWALTSFGGDPILPAAGLIGGKLVGLGMAGRRQRDFDTKNPSKGAEPEKKAGMGPVQVDLSSNVPPAPSMDSVRPGLTAGVLASLALPAALAGGALGAARSPSVYGVQGAGRGAMMGGGTALGAALGAGLGGSMGGGGVGATAAGGLAGAGLGALASRLAMGQNPRDKDRAAAEERQKQRLAEKSQTKTAAIERLVCLLA